VKRTQARALPANEAHGSRKRGQLRTGHVERPGVLPTNGPKMDPHDPMNPTL
jgi:hypothetical protein